MTVVAKTNWLGLQKSNQDARQCCSREIPRDVSQQKSTIPKRGADLGSFLHPGKAPQPHPDLGTKFPAHPCGPSWGQTEHGLSTLPVSGTWEPEVRRARLSFKEQAGLKQGGAALRQRSSQEGPVLLLGDTGANKSPWSREPGVRHCGTCPPCPGWQRTPGGASLDLWED